MCAVKRAENRRLVGSDARVGSLYASFARRCSSMSREPPLLLVLTLTGASGVDVLPFLQSPDVVQKVTPLVATGLGLLVAWRTYVLAEGACPRQMMLPRAKIVAELAAKAFADEHDTGKSLDTKASTFIAFTGASGSVRSRCRREATRGIDSCSAWLVRHRGLPASCGAGPSSTIPVSRFEGACLRGDRSGRVGAVQIHGRFPRLALRQNGQHLRERAAAYAEAHLAYAAALFNALLHLDGPTGDLAIARYSLRSASTNG